MYYALVRLLVHSLDNDLHGPMFSTCVIHVVNISKIITSDRHYHDGQCRTQYRHFTVSKNDFSAIR